MYIATPWYQQDIHHQWRHLRSGRQAAIDTLDTKCCYPRLAVKTKPRNFNIWWLLTLLPRFTTTERLQIYPMPSEIPGKSMVNTAELRQILPLRENTLCHVVEGDGRYPRAMTPSGIRCINLSHHCHNFRGCVPHVVVPSYAVSFINIPEKMGFASFITVQYYDVRKWSSTLWPDGRIRLFAYYDTSLSSLCRTIWKYWTTKLLIRHILSRLYVLD